MNAEETLIMLISLLIFFLEEELADVSDSPDRQFAYGEKTAYVECLEFLAEWEKASDYGLDFDVEKRFPL